MPIDSTGSLVNPAQVRELEGEAAFPAAGREVDGQIQSTFLGQDHMPSCHHSFTTE
ncbi:protein of unknown function (plasmid) [Rhodovastum atsumiense]|nr:protein of unknown function [Rhodovastum atsumiense]